MLPLAIFVAWFFLKFFDEPVRAWLTRDPSKKASMDAPQTGQDVQIQPIFWDEYVGAVRIVA